MHVGFTRKKRALKFIREELHDATGVIGAFAYTYLYAYVAAHMFVRASCPAYLHIHNKYVPKYEHTHILAHTIEHI